MWCATGQSPARAVAPSDTALCGAGLVDVAERGRRSPLASLVDGLESGRQIRRSLSLANHDSMNAEPLSVPKMGCR